MVSYAWAAPRLEAGDEIVLTVMEHHANIVPWHFLRERQGVVLKWVDIEPDGSLDPLKVMEAVGPRTRLIAVTHMSNVLGTVVDVHHLRRGAGARRPGAGRRQPGGRAPAGERGRARLRLLRDHRSQALRADRFRCALCAAGAAGRDAAVPRRWRHDPRGPEGRDHLRRPAAQDGSGNPGDRADHRARGGARVYDRARDGEHRRARADTARLRQRAASRAELAAPSTARRATRARSFPSRCRGRRIRTTSRRWWTARAWRCARAITARSR